MYLLFRNRSCLLLTILIALAPSPCAAGTTQAAVGVKKTQATTANPTQSNAPWQASKTAGDCAALRGNFAEAEEKYQAALALAEKAKDNRAVLTCQSQLANCLAAQGNKFSEEEPLRQKAVELAEKAFGAASPQLAANLAELADLQARKGETGLAEENTDRATKILGQSEDKFPLEMAMCYQAIAERQVATHSLGLAEDSYKKALDLRSAKLPANDLAVLDTCRRYADLLNQLDRKDEAKKLQERLTLARAEAPGGNPTAASGATKSGSAKPDTSKPDKSKSIFPKLVVEAKEAGKAGDQSKVVTCWKAVVQEAEKSDAKDGRLPYALVHLGDAYSVQGSKDEAAALYKRAMDLREQQGATKSLGMVRNITRLANVAQQNKNLADAARLYTRAVEVEDEQNAPDAIVADTLQKMIGVCMLAKDNAHVEVAAKRLISLAEKIGGATGAMQKNMASAMLGSVYMKSGRMGEGIQLMKSMTKMSKQDSGDFANLAKDAYAADEALYDKSEEAAFLN